MTGFISIAVTSLNSIAQLAVVFNCKPAKHTFVLLARSIFGRRSRVFGFTMLLLESFGSDAVFEQLFRTAAGTLFRTKRFHQQPTQPQLVYSAVGGRKCGRIPRTQPEVPQFATLLLCICICIMIRNVSASQRVAEISLERAEVCYRARLSSVLYRAT